MQTQLRAFEPNGEVFRVNKVFSEAGVLFLVVVHVANALLGDNEPPFQAGGEQRLGLVRERVFHLLSRLLANEALLDDRVVHVLEG